MCVFRYHGSEPGLIYIVSCVHHQVDKVVRFLHWSFETLPPSAYTIIADDDVYIDSAALAGYLATAPRERLYAGESRPGKVRRPIR